MQRVLGLLIMVIVVGLVGCGSQSPAPASPASAVSAAETNAQSEASCAPSSAAVALPAAFPSKLPLPPQTAVLGTQDLGQGRIIIKGYVPADLRTAADFFQRELPSAGFQLGKGDAEMDEAESLFQGNGYTGKWRVNGIAGCSGAVTLYVIVQPVNLN